MGNLFDKWMNWCEDDSAFLELTKIGGSVIFVIALLSSPFLYVAYQNDKALEKRFDELDKSFSEIFNSISQCIKAGYSQFECMSSQTEAYDIAGELGTTISYDKRNSCLKNHGDCEKEPHLAPIITRVGDTTVTNYVPQTSYHPDVVAWQALSRDISNAVPLYRSAETTKAIRRDGKMFTL